MQHHEVFSRFRRSSCEIPQGYHADFLGTQARHEFTSGLRGDVPVPYPERRTIQDYPYPLLDEDYFEWIDLLESVMAASESYPMIDLGAGFGKWAVRAAFAPRQYHPKLPCHVIAVEPEPTGDDWMKEHFRHNGIKPRRHTLLHAAVTGEPGEVEFCIGGPRGGPYDRPPSAWYGQFLTQGNAAFGESRPDGKYCGFQVMLHTSGWRLIRVPGVSLGSLLQKLRRLDLIDLDMEGQELAALTSAAAQLDAKVKRLHIGTHSQAIEAGLRRLLSAHGWQCHAGYPLSSTSETPWGPVGFENGVQSWVNPR